MTHKHNAEGESEIDALREPSAYEPDRPSSRMVRNWAKLISKGRANVIPVFVAGGWTLHVLRGHKRVLQFSLGKAKRA